MGSAKDPVDLAGMASQNVLLGDVGWAHWHEMAGLNPVTTVLLFADDRVSLPQQ